MSPAPVIEELTLRCPQCTRYLARTTITLDPADYVCECGWSGRTVFYRQVPVPTAGSNVARPVPKPSALYCGCDPGRDPPYFCGEHRPKDWRDHAPCGDTNCKICFDYD